MKRAHPLLALSSLLLGCGSPTERTAYDIELRELEQRIEQAWDAGTRPQAPEIARGRLAYLLYSRASLTGHLADFREAERQIAATQDVYPDSAELVLLKVDLNIKLHRFAEALQDLNRLKGETTVPKLLPRFADISLQYGHYGEAEALYEKLASADPSWDNLARLAHYVSHTGNAERAEALYARAQDSLSAREMRAYAWLELQRGMIDLDAQRYDLALAHFETANRAYSGYWLIEEHLAEALSLTGQTKRAVKIYEEAIRSAPHPYLLAALARLLDGSDPERATLYLERAEQAFRRDFAAYPEAALGHYIEQRLQAGKEARETLELARRNHELRPNVLSEALLARAYLANGDAAEAAVLVEDIAAGPWRTPSVSALLCRFDVDAATTCR